MGEMRDACSGAVNGVVFMLGIFDLTSSLIQEQTERS